MKTVIFDFDGTIADSFELVIEIAHDMTHRPELVMPEEIVHLRKLKLVEVAKALKLPRWQWPFLLLQGRRQMSRRLNEVRPFPGIAEVIEQLHGHGCQLYIMSSNSKKNVQKFLKQHKLAHYFVRIYGGIGIFGKTAALKRILRSNKIAAADALYIGDEARDITGSRGAGVSCIAVAWGYNGPELLADHKPLAVVTSLEELKAAVEAWAV